MGELLSGITGLSSGEMTAATRALVSAPAGRSDREQKEVVTSIFAAFYRTRFGVAPGSTAVNLKTGQSAIRFWDQVNREYRWAVHDSPQSPTQQVRYTADLSSLMDWTVSERPWNDLVYKGAL